MLDQIRKGRDKILDNHVSDKIRGKMKTKVEIKYVLFNQLPLIMKYIDHMLLYMLYRLEPLAQDEDVFVVPNTRQASKNAAAKNSL